MAVILSAQSLAAQLEPLLERAGLFPAKTLRLSPDLSTFRDRLIEALPSSWLGAPWGSWAFFSVVHADTLARTQIEQLMDHLFETSQHLMRSRESWVFHTAAGTLSGTGPLGIYGRVLFVWEAAPNVAIPDVQRMKRSRFLKKYAIVPWAAVLLARRVYGHRGLPLTMGAPSVRDLQQLISP